MRAPGGAQTIRDLDTVRHVLTGSGTPSLFDLPWTPVFIAACFYLHPVIGGITLFGVLLVLGSRGPEPVDRLGSAGPVGACHRAELSS